RRQLELVARGADLGWTRRRWLLVLDLAKQLRWVADDRLPRRSRACCRCRRRRRRGSARCAACEGTRWRDGSWHHRHTGLSPRRARRLESQKEELLGDVGLLQRALLPEVPERIGPLATSVAYRPADGPAAGGDFYDVFEIEGGKIGVIVGDVCGHGRQALA